MTDKCLKMDYLDHNMKIMKSLVGLDIVILHFVNIISSCMKRNLLPKYYCCLDRASSIISIHI